MKRTVLILVSILFLTSCGGSELPDPNMALPDTPPNSELMQPTSNPE